jgi:hypothetical protein
MVCFRSLLSFSSLANRSVHSYTVTGAKLAAFLHEEVLNRAPRSRGRKTKDGSKPRKTRSSTAAVPTSGSAGSSPSFDQGPTRFELFKPTLTFRPLSLPPLLCPFYSSNGLRRCRLQLPGRHRRSVEATSVEGCQHEHPSWRVCWGQAGSRNVHSEHGCAGQSDVQGSWERYASLLSFPLPLNSTSDLFSPFPQEP